MPNRKKNPRSRPPIIEREHTYESVTDKISSIVLTRKTPKVWIFGLIFSFVFVVIFLNALAYLFLRGIGIWGVNSPVMWGFAIINFVWWIGIGHAGTLISAILFLVRREWRTSINRFTEAMTLFAIGCASIFPLIHLGRPWKFYYMIPYPNTMGLSPQFQSALLWDFFAVLTYAIVSSIFWYIGLMPDLATFRDRAKSRWLKIVYACLALGWRGSARHWERYQICYLLLAGLAAPLVISVHTVVSLDFAATIIPGWHSTIFPPYFVAGAIYSGFAMVLTLAIPIRAVYKLQDFITMRHLENMAKVLLATCLMVAYGYFVEGFMAWYSANPFEQYTILNRITGPYAAHGIGLIFCNVFVPQLLWFKRIRTNVLALFVIAMIVNAGMWLERFVIVVTALHRDFLPSSWGFYSGNFWDWATYLGTLGLFGMMFFLFVRVLPMISAFEMRELLHRLEDKK